MLFLERIKTWRGALVIASASWALVWGGVVGYFGALPYFVESCPPSEFLGFCEPAPRLSLSGLALTAFLLVGALIALVRGRSAVLLCAWTLMALGSVADGLLLFIPAVRRWEGVGPAQDIGRTFEFIFAKPIVLIFFTGLILVALAWLPGLRRAA